MVKPPKSSNIKIQGQSNIAVPRSEGNIAIGQAKVLYKQPEIYMVPLHEITDIAQEDWFLETVNIIAGVLLGIATERLFTAPDLAWSVLSIVSIVVIAYRIYRRYQQDKKIAELKKKAISYDGAESEKRL